jgi:hypothetical protein
MIDPMTFSDDRLRTLIRRMDRGEITRGEFCHVMAEHQVDFARFHRIGAEVDAERGWRGWIADMAETAGWPALVAMGACYAFVATLLALATAVAWITPGR